MNIFDCDLAMDLLPSYLEKKTGEETIKYIEEHVKNCPKCKAMLDAMAADIPIEASVEKKVFHINPVGKVILLVLGYFVFVLILLIIITYLFVHGVL